MFFLSASICSISPRTRSSSCSTSRTSDNFPVRLRSRSVSRCSVLRAFESRACRSTYCEVTSCPLCDSASRLDFGQRSVELIGGNAQGRGERAPAARVAACLQFADVTAMPFQYSFEVGSRFVELLRDQADLGRADDHRTVGN